MHDLLWNIAVLLCSRGLTLQAVFVSGHVCLSSLFQSDRLQSGVPADVHRSKAQTSAQSPSPSGLFAPSSRQPLERQRPPANQRLASQSEGDLLLGALRQYLSGHWSLHGGAVQPAEQGSPWSRLTPSHSVGIENSGLKKETSTSRLLKMGRTQGASVKDPLTSVDGTCSPVQRGGCRNQ